jgi:hypothetical protein
MTTNQGIMYIQIASNNNSVVICKKLQKEIKQIKETKKNNSIKTYT